MKGSESLVSTDGVIYLQQLGLMGDRRGIGKS